jgi:hypothetical protein
MKITVLDDPEQNVLGHNEGWADHRISEVETEARDLMKRLSKLARAGRMSQATKPPC